MAEDVERDWGRAKTDTDSNGDESSQHMFYKYTSMPKLIIAMYY